MSSIRVGLSFNLRGSGGRDGPEDLEAEYDAWSTVSAIAEALSFGGASTVHLLPVEGDLPRLLERTRPDIVFNIAEGQAGRSREMLVPALLEMMGIPYTGSDPVALGVAMDKALAKAVAVAAGVPTAPWQVASHPDDPAALGRWSSFPAFVKPLAEGSSKGVRASSRVHDSQELARQVHWVLTTYRQPALVEAYLPGREFSVGLLGNGAIEVLPVLEVRPTRPVGDISEFVYCYHTKSGNLETFLCPAPIDPELRRDLQAYSEAIFQALGLRDVARVDFRLDADGVPHFLEVNPLPGLSPASLLTAQAQAAGLTLPDLVAGILLAAINRWLLAPDLEPSRRSRLLAVAEAARAALSHGGGRSLLQVLDGPDRSPDRGTPPLVTLPPAA